MHDLGEGADGKIEVCCNDREGTEIEGQHRVPVEIPELGSIVENLIRRQVCKPGKDSVRRHFSAKVKKY